MTWSPPVMLEFRKSAEEKAREAEAEARAMADTEAEIAGMAEDGPVDGPAAEPPPRGLTPRMEAFCQAYVAHPVGTLAATDAGYSRAHARKIGSRLLRSPSVARRIAELRRVTAARCAEGRAQLVAKLESVIAGAIKDHNWAAAARSIALQARLAGLGPLHAEDAPAADAAPDDPAESRQKWTEVDRKKSALSRRRPPPPARRAAPWRCESRAPT